MWQEKIQTPKLTVDAIVEYDNKIILIERKYPPLGWALPGGFVNIGESVEDAVKREIKEEINVELYNLKQFHVYSNPERDFRFHTVSVVFTAKSNQNPVAGDDAKNSELFTYDKIIKMIELKQISFDHDIILNDYLNITNT